MQPYRPCSELNAQGNSRKRFPQYIQSASIGHHHSTKDQFYRPNEYSTTWQTSNESFHQYEGENLSNSSAGLPSPSFHDKGSQMIQMTRLETLPVSNGPPKACTFLNHAEAPKILALSSACNGRTPNLEMGPGSYDLMRFGHTSVVADKLPLTLPPRPSEPCSLQAESLRSLQLFLQGIVQPGGLTDPNGGNMSSEEDIKFGTSCNLDCSNHKNRSLPIEAQVCSTSLSCASSDFYEERGQCHQDGHVNIMKGLEVTVIKNSDNFSEESLSRSSVASTVVEKLWDGSLQLNSSVTVSAVAFFKSGEKMPNINWSAFVEVKGKVKLQAFEKYIQDLPRSRTRGLMVVSLRYKTGSSETGLTDMKEVAKKYREVKKVGRAQLSAGVDIYICPHSDTIITILAKNGFFKGKTATEDDQDSLIGCVVWRKNQATDSISKKPGETAALKPLNAASDSCHQETDSSSAQESREPASVRGNIEYKILMGHEVEGSTSNSVITQSPLGHLEVPISKRHIGLEQPPKGSLEPKKSFPPLRSNVIRHAYDDDDLPEFDFTTAGKISQALSCNPYNAVTLEKKILYNVAQESDRPLPAIGKEMAFPDHRPQTPPPEGFPPRKKAHVYESRAPMPNLESARRKNLFDDEDDDMPEWQPQAPCSEKTLSSSSSVPTCSYGSTQLGHLPVSPPKFPESSSLPANINLRPVQQIHANEDFPRGSSPQTGLNSNPPLLPLPKKYKIKLPVLPSGHSRNLRPSNVKRSIRPNVWTRRRDDR